MMCKPMQSSVSDSENAPRTAVRTDVEKCDYKSRSTYKQTDGETETKGEGLPIEGMEDGGEGMTCGRVMSSGVR